MDKITLAGKEYTFVDPMTLRFRQMALREFELSKPIVDRTKYFQTVGENGDVIAIDTAKEKAAEEAFTRFLSACLGDCHLTYWELKLEEADEVISRFFTLLKDSMTQT